VELAQEEQSGGSEAQSLSQPPVPSCWRAPASPGAALFLRELPMTENNGTMDARACGIFSNWESAGDG